MQTEAVVIFPHQLFAQHPALHKDRLLVFVEEQLLFGDYHYPATFHKAKLALHRASMRAFADNLQRRGFRTHYSAYQPDAAMRYLFEPLRAQGITRLHVADPVDCILARRLDRHCAARGIALVVHDTPAFLTPRAWFDDVMPPAAHYSLTSFYIKQRKRLNVLIDHGKPCGGRWTFDTENRQAFDNHVAVPPLPTLAWTTYRREAAAYVAARFPENPGSVDDQRYPVTHAEARRWLDDFLAQRLRWFGDYEDAMARDHSFLFHSVLSASINIGLLTPHEVLARALDAAAEYAIPRNALEGFVRQVIGWREFMRLMYERIGVAQRTTNFWRCTRAMPQAFYHATTGLAPVDHVVRRVQSRAYCHHIERLMVLGNAMLLCEISPDSVYRWFMELFIDAYDWVMVPNVYGMSQFADGGRMTTKPYISGSAYLHKMSDFPRGSWCGVWDALFWRFIGTHHAAIAANPRMRMLAAAWARLDRARKAAHCKTADAFLAELV